MAEEGGENVQQPQPEQQPPQPEQPKQKPVVDKATRILQILSWPAKNNKNNNRCTTLTVTGPGLEGTTESDRKPMQKLAPQNIQLTI
jgi:hypothetical protein